MAKHALLIFLISGFSSCLLAGQQYELFAKDNRYGLKDAEGNVSIPAVYDKLGWSNGSTDLFEDIIGYQLDGSWGLVSVNNKVLTSNKFYRLAPLSDQYIKATIKGSFSNLLFNGLIDKKGKIVLSCYYFDVEPLGPFFEVSSYKDGSIRKGLLTEDFRLIVPINFHEITLISDQSVVASTLDGKSALFHQSGSSDGVFYDDYSIENEKIIVKKAGKYGLLQLTSLTEIEPVIFKSFDSSMNPIPFPSWWIADLELDSIGHYSSDSVDVKDRFYVTHINGSQEVITDGKQIFGEREINLRYAYSGFLIAEDRFTKKWTLATTSGNIIIEQQDSISFDGTYFGAKGPKGWQVFNRFGRKLSIKTFQSLDEAVSSMIPVKRNGFWALMDFQGDFVTNFKFDRIVGGHSNRIMVDYLGNFGLVNAFGDWVIKPSLDDIFMTDQLVVGQHGDRWSIYDLNGGVILELDCEKVEDQGEYLAFSTGDGGYGILSSSGNYLADPIYDTVGRVGDFLFGKKSGYVSLFSLDGIQKTSANEGIQDIHSVGQGLYKITKDDKIGYVDSEARLRIANRYDDGGIFQENRLPIKLLGRWGYVDQFEQLIIQPRYDSAGTFIEGLAVVQKNGLYGLIDHKGEELLPCEYEKIGHSKGGGYLIKRGEGAWGALNSSGSIVLTPNYSNILEASNGLLMVNRNGSWGIISSEGFVKVPFKYQEIKQVGDYFLFKSLPDQ